MNGKKLLITGGLGNLGSWLSIHFSSKFDVYILSKSLSIQLDCPHTIIQADISNYEDLKSKLTINFDYCIHTASYNEFFKDNYAKDALMINTLGTRNLLEILKETNLKNFIYLSTYHVYGTQEGVIKESTALCPKNDYASTHLFAEYYIKQFFHGNKFPFVIFRLTNSYGAPKYGNNTKWYLILNDFVKQSIESNQIIINSNIYTERDFIWMGDVCSVIEKSLDFKADCNNIFNLSSGETFKIIDIAYKVQHIYKKRFHRNLPIISKSTNNNIHNHLIVDNTKLTKKINYSFNNSFNKEIESLFNLMEQ